MKLRQSQSSMGILPMTPTATMGRMPMLLVAIVFFVPLFGCGGGNSLDLAPVTGKVTFRGEPLDHGTVVFFPTGNTKGPQALGEIQPDGSFTMKTVGKAGAVVGKHKVTVQCRRVVTLEEAKDLVVGELLIPKQYTQHDSTSLKINVEKGGSELPIELK